MEREEKGRWWGVVKIDLLLFLVSNKDMCVCVHRFSSCFVHSEQVRFLTLQITPPKSLESRNICYVLLLFYPFVDQNIFLKYLAINKNNGVYACMYHECL